MKEQSTCNFTFSILNAASRVFVEQKLIARYHKQLRVAQAKVKTVMTGMVEGDQHCGRPATRWFDDNGSTLPDGVELASTGRSGESHATVAHMNE